MGLDQRSSPQTVKEHFYFCHPGGTWKEDFDVSLFLLEEGGAEHLQSKLWASGSRMKCGHLSPPHKHLCAFPTLFSFSTYWSFIKAQFSPANAVPRQPLQTTSGSSLLNWITALRVLKCIALFLKCLYHIIIISCV